MDLGVYVGILLWQQWPPMATVLYYQCLLMSEFFKTAAKDNRVSMFDEWSISQPKMREGKRQGQEKSKPQQVRRAQQLLNDAQQLNANISGFLRLKGDLQWHMGDEQRRSSALLQQVFALNNSRSKNLGEQQSMVARMRQILRELYRCLRSGRALQDYMVGCFQVANLANFDPKVHQLRGGKGAEVAERELNARLQLLGNSCSKLYRSLHYLDKLDGVFGKEESFQYCFVGLQQQLSHDSQVKIHALMVSMLVQIEQKRVALSATNRSVEAEYRKYELVYDCLQLMKTEREEMVREVQILRKDQEQVTSYVPVDGQGLLDNNKLQLDELNNRQTMQKIVESEAHVENNLKVYRTNLQNFKRVSAETSLYCYAYREAQFAESLNQLEGYFGGWKKDQAALGYFYGKRNELLEFRDHQSVKRSTTDSDRQYVTNLYGEVRDKKAGNNPNIQLYQQHVLTDIERELKQRNIPYAPRQINPAHVKTVLGKQDDFFEALARTDKREKIVYLRKNRSTINGLIFELGQVNVQGTNSDLATAKAIYGYSNALAYCKVIASEQSLEKQVHECEGLLAEGRSYKELPKGVSELVLAYVHDANLVVKSHAEREALRVRNLGGFGQAVEGEVREKRKGKVDESVEANMYLFSEHWINFYASYYRLLTPYGEILMLDELLSVGAEIGRRVRDSVTEKDIVEITARNLEIEKGMFYSYRVLLSLVQVSQRSAQQAQKFRVANLDALLVDMMDHLQHYFMVKPVNTKPTDLLKLTLLQTFLAKCYPHSDYPSIVRALRLQVFLQIVSELYVEHISNVGIAESWLHPLLTIQLRMKTISVTGSDPKTKAMADKANTVLPELRKLPLAISAQHDVSRVPNAMEMRDYLDELQGISLKQGAGLGEAAIAWQALKLVEDAQSVVKQPFEKYENAVVSEKRSVVKEFGQVWAGVEQDLARTGDRQPLARYFADAHSPVPLRECILPLLRKA